MTPLFAPALTVDRSSRSDRLTATDRPSRSDRPVATDRPMATDRPALTVKANSSIAAEPTVCCYVNPTGQIQIARIANIPNWYFERVVFPSQRLLFEAPAQALLEIHTGTIASAILADTIPCGRLRVG
jgi:Domain of unknown function (DUF1830)